MIFEINYIKDAILKYEQARSEHAKRRYKSELRYIVSTIPRNKIPQIIAALEDPSDDILNLFEV